MTSKWVGESEKLVRTLFEVARKCQPSIIFLDECDSLLSERQSGESDNTRRLKTEFLAQCDGVSSSENDRIVLLGATNRPWDLDTAVLRRFPRRIYLPLPNVDQRSAILKQWVKKNPTQIVISYSDVNMIANLTEMYSASDMTQLLRDASLASLRELPLDVQQTINSNDVRPIAANDLVRSMEQIRPSFTDAKLLKKYQEWSSNLGS